MVPIANPKNTSSISSVQYKIINIVCNSNIPLEPEVFEELCDEIVLLLLEFVCTLNYEKNTNNLLWYLLFLLERIQDFWLCTFL